MRQHSVRYQLYLCVKFLSLRELIGFLTVAAHVSKLQVADIRRVTAFRYRDYMIYARRERVRELEAEVNRLSAYPTHFLRCIYLLFV